MKKAGRILVANVTFGILFVLAHTTHAAPPAGFASTKYVDLPFLATDIQFAPDGRLFALDQQGSVRVVKDGVLNETPFVTLKVSANRERGVLGMVFHPSYATNRQVFVYYTTGPGSKNYAGSPKNRLSRFTASATNPDVAEAGSEKIILDNIASDAGVHNAGCLRIGPDGKLYISTGDGGITHANSQNLGNLNGKILRLNVDGTIPTDNPYYGQAGKRGEIWAYGLRNPWRFAFHPSNGTMFIADVGEGSYEEVNISGKGKNYGWPQTEGPKPANSAGVTYPVYSYTHTAKGGSIIGGEVYNGSSFPSSYKGKYFFADFVQYFIRAMSYDPDTQEVSVETFDPNVGGMIDITFGPDGAMYVDVGDSATSSHVQKIAYTGGAVSNRPTADVYASTRSGPLPLGVVFSAAGSEDPVGKGLTYDWDFGDGLRAKGRIAGHVYKRKGKYRVLLTVKDSRGTMAQASMKVLAGYEKPVVTWSTPKKGTLYRAGDIMRYAATATDSEDGTLDASQFRWTVVFHHAAHTHPFLGPLTGKKSGSFRIPDDGETAHDVWYRLALTVSDSDGLTTTIKRDIRPWTIPVDITSNIANPGILLDGETITTPKNLLVVSRFPRVVEAPATAVVGDTAYTFSQWSDGSTVRRRVIRSTTKRVQLRALYTATE